MKMTFIGGGNMATALIGGMRRQGAAAEAFHVVEPYAEQREKLAARFPGIGLYADAADVSGDALRDAGVVVFAVKPQQMQAAATALVPWLTPQTVVLTIAAGIRLDDLRRWLRGHLRLVRAMPNTPALIGRGISGVFAAPEVDDAGRATACAVLEAAGEVLWVADEAMLDAVTAISGSGPAYVFYFLEAVMQAGHELGFAPADARKLAYATFSGALALAEASEHDAATLRAQVTSKGGTTERAIATMEAALVKPQIVLGVKAAAERAREMGEAFGGDASGAPAATGIR